MEAQTLADQRRLKKIMRKVDFRQITILALVYIWAYIDRSNLGNVSWLFSLSLGLKLPNTLADNHM